jgi:serine/threonine protein kinase
MITGTPYIGPEVDIWSLGIVLYVFLCGTLPFNDDNQPRLFDKILRGVFQCPDDLSLGENNFLNQFLLLLLLLIIYSHTHSKLTESRDLLSRMIVVDPTQRLTIEQVLVHPWVTGELGPVQVYLPERPRFVEPDERLLQQLPSYGCDVERVKADLRAGIFSPDTSVYHLLVEKARIEHEKQLLRQQQEKEAEQRALLSSRALLSARGRRSQHQIPPPFDPTTTSASASPPSEQTTPPITPDGGMTPAQLQILRMRNSRRTLAGNAEQEMQAARSRFMSSEMNQQQMNALGKRLTPVGGQPLPQVPDMTNTQIVSFLLLLFVVSFRFAPKLVLTLFSFKNYK